MSQELTLKVAQKFLQDNDAVDLREFNSIADAAAEALAEHEGSLRLTGLTTLSDAALAEALAKHEGDLYLSGLTTLSDATAEALGKHEGEVELNGQAEAGYRAAKLKVAEKMVMTKSPKIKTKIQTKKISKQKKSTKTTAKKKLGGPVQLRKALVKGDVETARNLIGKLSLDQICMALYEGDGVESAVDFLNATAGDRLRQINSPQHVLRGKPRVVTLAEVAEKCGPVYGPFCTFSFGDRPAGWGAAACENRVLSWMDQGLGLVGDQTVNIDDRYITARPLDEFEGALIAGPLGSVEVLELPKEQQVVSWKGRPLTIDPFEPAVFREVFSKAMMLNAQLQWTYDFRSNAAAREAFLFYHHHDEADQHADILLAKAVMSPDEGSREKLTRAVELDPSIKPWADWIEAWIGFPDNMERIAELKNTDRLGSALVACCQTYVDLKAGKVVTLEPLESLVGMQYDPQSPYLGYMLARVTEMCIGEALDGKESIEDGGDPTPYAQALRMGFRGQQAKVWLMNAIKANHNSFVRLCLDSGFKPVGRFGPCYLNLLATAAFAENAEAVRAFLEHGADPDEPSHYGGQSSLALCEYNKESGEIMQVLRTARKRFT